MDHTVIKMWWDVMVSMPELNVNVIDCGYVVKIDTPEGRIKIVVDVQRYDITVIEQYGDQIVVNSRSIYTEETEELCKALQRHITDN